MKLTVQAQSFIVELLEQEAQLVAPTTIDISKVVRSGSNWYPKIPVGVYLRGHLHLLSGSDRNPRTGYIPVKILSTKAFYRCRSVHPRKETT